MYNQKCNEMSDSCRERLENGAYLEIFLHNVSIIKFFGHKIILIMSYYSHFKHSCFYLSQKNTYQSKICVISLMDIPYLFNYLSVLFITR